jgi:very-short-patch-repair endonuclease
MCSLAARQHGVVTRAQLRAAGVSADEIRHRMETGLLTALHRGVYRLGPIHTVLTGPMAAALACGPAAAVSHHAAAALHGLRPVPPGPVDVTVTRGHARRRPGLRIHRSRTLDATQVRGIPTTTVARTIRDLAAVLPARDLARLVEEAQVQRKLDRPSLARAVEQARGHRGAAALRAAAGDEPRLTRSEGERRLLELVRAARLPEPETNVRVGGYEVDALWRAERLVVEVDGFAFHSTRAAFERDRRKTSVLQTEGFRVERLTWRRLEREREAVVATLAAALSAARASGRRPAAAAPPGSPPGRSRS